MMGAEDIARIQEQLGRLAIQVAEIDLDGFIEVTEAAGSPQALAAGIEVGMVNSAAGWTEMARLLKPFRDDAIERVAEIRAEAAAEEEDLVPRESACPHCGEQRTDHLAISDDGRSVTCATCGRRYALPQGKECEAG